jgi:cephalosporin hydroxylase/molybdopterin converting factor small subunit
MARVVLIGNLSQITGGVAEFTVSATSIKQLFAQLAELHPALGPHLAEGVAVAIDGQIYQDTLLEPIGPDSEVFILPQIAGGEPTLTRLHLDATARATMLARAANPMETAYYAQEGRAAYKWHHSLEVFDRHLARFRGRPVRLLEIGIYRGGSLQVWKRYFGEHAIIHGIDHEPACARVAEDRIVPHIGSQSDVDFLRRVVDEMGGVDVVVDDGGHLSDDQIATFEALYPLIDPHGVYVCEDTRTSYWSRFRGGYRQPDTFIEYAKALVDGLHAWHIEDAALARDDTFARTTLGVFFYDSVVVVEKRPHDRPVQYSVGREEA